MRLINYSLILGIIVHIACQVFKLIYYSLKDGRLNFHYLVTAGGMPSTHSAFTSTVALSLGLTKGFDSEYFAIAFTFTAIVIYDSLRLRGAVQTHSDILLQLAEKLPAEEKKKIPRMVGHTFTEIVVGLGLAVIFSVGGYLMRPLFGF